MIPHLPDEIWLKIVFYAEYDSVFPLRSVSNLNLALVCHEEVTELEEYLAHTGKTIWSIQENPNEEDLKEWGYLGDPWMFWSKEDAFEDWFGRPPFVNPNPTLDKTDLPKALIQQKVTDFFRPPMDTI